LSYDSPETLRAFAERQGITYTLMSDPGSETIDAWGLRNQQAEGRAEGVPHPGMFVIDTDGRIVERAFEAAYQERSTAASVLARLGVEIPSETSSRTAGKQVSVEAGTSDPTAAPGARLTLIADVTPGEKMHVYAPGQDAYISVTLTLDDSDDFKLAAPASFPAPGSYYFEPLDETVKVYDEPFRIAQEITLALSREFRQRAAARETLTVTGTLAYQACDDAVCYRPDSIPMSWTVSLVPFQR
jgi:hypothetical protein